MTSTDGGGSALRWLLLSTAVAGFLGYVIQVAAPRLLDGSSYVSFSVTWSTVYLGVAAMSGVQQEVARAARPSRDHKPNTVLRSFTLSAIAVVIVVALGVAAWLTATTLPLPFVALGTVLSIAFVGYLVNAVLSGALYGLQLWRGVALITALDAVLRIIFLAVAFALGADPLWLGLGIAFPFGLSFALAWLVLRRGVVGRFALDVGFAKLSRNVLSTVGAAACSGVMISGLPLLIGATSATIPASAVGALLMAINLTRAPIVVPVVAMQSYLISAVFRDRDSVAPRRLFGLLGVAITVMAALSATAYFVGPWLVALISAGSFDIDAHVIAIVVFSAGLVALMCVTGPALVARGGHLANVVGWSLAAALTVACLVLPVDFTVRTLLALTAPAIAGLAAHVIALLGAARRTRPPAPDGMPC
ncbi:hypothetical protein AUC47_02090 [Microbacterium sp. SZ1]|uniref:hypothetical protein n=1 Tax=Microbacterium sp. SZ1 TaxID=1849736 RepID=UPI000BBC4B54|nr:hypothetical protein [Microbacterium sp. SZ1]PCE14952.1 hypothetical protein AUC47_02090 [Microbacterium sp. SZ1]